MRGTVSPTRTYDIFSDTDAAFPTWLECVVGYSSAFERLQSIAEENPGSYFIYSSDAHRIVYAVNTTLIEKPN
jgi:hypothetical protein